MAKFNPGKLTDEDVQVTDVMKLTLELPAKTFSSGKKGFFRQGIYETPEGKKYRLNLQAYEME